MQTICAISDTHGNPDYVNEIPECDILLHCGDIAPDYRGNTVDLQKKWFHSEFIQELQSTKAKNVVFIGGNHDFYLDKLYTLGMEDKFRESLPSNMFYLRDSSAVVNGLTIYGSPWVENLRRWAFHWNPYIPMHHAYSNVPAKPDIILLHSPPHGYSDVVIELGETEHLGGKQVLNMLSKVRGANIFCGHIHGASHESVQVFNSTLRNVAYLNERYTRGYAPCVMTLNSL